ncbi:MAG: RluA family pseudouridine synthase [Spirochaetaceae bacterium]|jgi:23S rRNA pseudouridine1911/1915/1917 synthase|nr:RluA family pseudouridine synthase [Spirochaetaceae bacterium]
MPQYEGIVTAEAGSQTRLDAYAAAALGLLTRSQMKSRNLTALVNGKAAKLSRPVKAGDHIVLVWDDHPPSALLPENIPLAIIHEDAACVVVNKPQGMVVHPGAGNRSGTLANALLWRRTGGQPADRPLPEMPHQDGTGTQPFMIRPFIVHRLDKDTSGVLIAAYTEDALNLLSRQFREHSVKKTYIAIVAGAPPEERGLIDTCLCRDSRNRKLFTTSEKTGKRAQTRYKRLRSWTDGPSAYSLLLLRPHTGRTHQLRVHLRHIGCPILGDPLYHKKDPRHPAATLMLHALTLEITLSTGEHRTFKAPLPERFLPLLPPARPR